MVVLSLVAIIIGLAFIIIRAFKGHPPFMSCLIAVVFISLLSGLSVPDAIASAFAAGTANMLKSMLLFFCACTMFGKVMEEAGYAHSIAYFISDHVKASWAPTIIFLTTVLLAMGGMLIATCIIVYPIGYRLLKKAGYSRRILAGANFAGFWTVTCCAPLIPSAANTLLQGMLGTNSFAGMVPGIATTVFLFVTIIGYMQWQVWHWKRKGIVFEDIPGEEGEEESREGLPSFGEAILPIALVLILYNLLSVPVAVSMFAAVVLTIVLRFKKFGLTGWLKIAEENLYAGIVPALNLSVMGGFGAVVALTPFYQQMLTWVGNSNINPYVLCWGGSALMAGIVGSSTSGISTLVPNIMPILESYAANGYNMGVFHRLLCVGSISLDSLPHNGSLMACCSLLHTDLKQSYFPVFVTCTLLPLIAGLCVTLPLSLLGFV